MQIWIRMWPFDFSLLNTRKFIVKIPLLAFQPRWEWPSHKNDRQVCHRPNNLLTLQSRVSKPQLIKPSPAFFKKPNGLKHLFHSLQWEICFFWTMVCGVNGKRLPVGGCLDAPGIHLEGRLGTVIWEHVAFLLFAGVKRRKPPFGGRSRVKWQHLPAFAPLNGAWGKAVCAFILLEVLRV